MITDLARAPQIDFQRLLETFSCRVHAFVRNGEPAVDLRAVLPADDANWLNVHGIPVYEDLPICLFGKGGDGKSLIGQHIAGQLALRGLRVGIVDWELDAARARHRLEREHGPEMPESPTSHARGHSPSRLTASSACDDSIGSIFWCTTVWRSPVMVGRRTPRWPSDTANASVRSAMAHSTLRTSIDRRMVTSSPSARPSGTTSFERPGISRSRRQPDREN